MHQVAIPHENAFRWVGPDGITVCPVTAMPAVLNDPAWWADMRAKTASGAYHPIPESESWWAQIQGGWTNDVAGRYSVLSAAFSLCWTPWERPHVVHGGTVRRPELVPDCHGEPMRWAPSGWVCRGEWGTFAVSYDGTGHETVLMSA